MTDLRVGIFGQRLRGPWLRSVLVAVLVALCTALMPLRAIADDMAATLRLADERMAQMANCHAKTLSRVIHLEFGCGFPALINKARIVEACRRIESPEYERYSLAGIGESVGFNNRTSFTTNFKKYTGLGLRDYRKAVMDGNKNKEEEEGDTENTPQ